MFVNDIKMFREKTGCSLMESKAAMEYANGDEILAIAYLKAKSFAVATPCLTFDERVQKFYKLELKGGSC